MSRCLSRYRRRARRVASRARVEATVRGRLAVVGTLDRLADIAEAAGDADAASGLDRCIAELCSVRPGARGSRLRPPAASLEDVKRAVFALDPDGQREILDRLLEDRLP